MSTAGILAAVDFHPRPSDSPGIFDSLGDRSLLSWSFDTLWEASCRPIVVVAPQAYIAAVKRELGPATVVESTGLKRTTMLDVLALIATERVVMLDFRHPLAASEDVRATVEALDGADASIGAIPVTETLKRVAEGVIVGTLDRTEMWHQVMPQAFRVGALRAAYQRAGGELTDDVRAIKESGARVKVVPVGQRNVAVNSRADLEVARALLGRPA